MTRTVKTGLRYLVQTALSYGSPKLNTIGKAIRPIFGHQSLLNERIPLKYTGIRLAMVFIRRWSILGGG